MKDLSDMLEKAKSWEISNIFRRSDSDSAMRATSSAYIRAFIILYEKEGKMGYRGKYGVS
jgi:hypothetical protein